MLHLSVKNIIQPLTESGTNRDSIEDRRNKGWGKVADISGILSQLPDIRKVEIGLKLRDTKLINGMIYSTEAWSRISDIEVTRLEQVDLALLRSLVEAHSKCSKAFILLEFGVISFSHLIRIRRIMYHHHIIRRDDKEMIKKIYLKQKEDNLKGDWFQTLLTDFASIKEDLDDERISKIPKEEYRKYIKQKVEKEAIESYMKLKEKCKKKMKYLEYDKLAIQSYIINGSFTLKQTKLLFSLRSHCYPAKINFRKMNRGNLGCSLGCNEDESQSHIFEKCKPLRLKLKLEKPTVLANIYGSVHEQRDIVTQFEQIDDQWKIMTSHILPGGSVARTPVKL